MGLRNRSAWLVALLASTVGAVRHLGFHAPVMGLRIRRAKLMTMAGGAPDETTPEKLRFLTPQKALEVQQEIGTPSYVYDMNTLEASARAALAFPNAYGLTVRYAMKASPNAAILQLFSKLGIQIDASSVYEIERAIRAGIPPEHISLSSQELADEFVPYVKKGVIVNACSVAQLERFGKAFPGGKVGLRFNPGLGSGGTGKTNVGGPSSSFGIWHELLDEVKAVLKKHNLTPIKIHTHIGSGSDPAVWQRVATLSLNIVKQFPTVEICNLGGGFKVGRMSYEVSTDLQKIGAPVKDLFVKFAEEDGRKLKLEIEPGTFLVANSAALVTTVQDKTRTSEHEFLKLDAGMTEVLRPSLYGAQHPLVIVPTDSARAGKNKKYVVVGHCCESGDLLTPAPGESETISERLVNEAEIGDVCVVEGSGAYCSSMNTKNYNSFPEAAEALLAKDGSLHIIRKRQTIDQFLQNEVAFPSSLLPDK